MDRIKTIDKLVTEIIELDHELSEKLLVEGITDREDLCDVIREVNRLTDMVDKCDKLLKESKECETDFALNHLLSLLKLRTAIDEEMSKFDK